MLPAFGPAVLPALLADLGKLPPLPAARRAVAACKIDEAAGLEALCKADAEVGRRQCREAMKKGSRALKRAARKCLQEIAEEAKPSAAAEAPAAPPGAKE
jgi:hypothetical protein